MYALFATDGEDWYFGGIDEHLRCMDKRIDLAQNGMGWGPESTFLIELPEPANAKLMAAVSKTEKQKVDWDSAMTTLLKEMPNESS